MKHRTLVLSVPEGAASFKMVRLVKTLEQAEAAIFQHSTMSAAEKRAKYIELLNSLETIHDGLRPDDERLHVNWRSTEAFLRYRALVETSFLLAGGEAHLVQHYVAASPVQIEGPREYRRGPVEQRDETPPPERPETPRETATERHEEAPRTPPPLPTTSDGKPQESERKPPEDRPSRTPRPEEADTQSVLRRIRDLRSKIEDAGPPPLPDNVQKALKDLFG